jgi:hypothetical protein
MVVALSALVVALGGSAIAAESGLESGDGVIQGCVATKTLVHRITDGVDAATNGALTPVTTGFNAVADGVDLATNGTVTAVTQAVTPKGALLVVPPGAACPQGTTPQKVSARVPTPPQIVESETAAPMRLGKDKAEVAAAKLPAAGDYLVNATARITAPGLADRPQTIKCALVGPEGTIPNATASVTVPANALVNHFAVPISKLVKDMPADSQIAVDCKDVAPGASVASASRSRAHTAQTPSEVTKAECEKAGGTVLASEDPDYYLPQCSGGRLDGADITATAGTTSTGTVEAAKAN